jgi:hypothetical protein
VFPQRRHALLRQFAEICRLLKGAQQHHPDDGGDHSSSLWDDFALDQRVLEPCSVPVHDSSLCYALQLDGKRAGEILLRGL